MGSKFYISVKVCSFWTVRRFEEIQKHDLIFMHKGDYIWTIQTNIKISCGI
jgi:hypothetical protein